MVKNSTTETDGPATTTAAPIDPRNVAVGYRSGVAYVAPPEVAPRSWLGPYDPTRPGSCDLCGGEDFWTSRWGVVICRACHPPAPGAEAGEGGRRGNENETA